MQNEKKTGRPYKGGRERTSNLQIRLTPEEHERLTVTARKNSMSVSDLFRALLLEQDMVESAGDEFVSVMVKNRPTSLTEQQAKDLYKQLSVILVG